jgi:hypothetical protein
MLKLRWEVGCWARLLPRRTLCQNSLTYSEPGASFNRSVAFTAQLTVRYREPFPKTQAEKSEPLRHAYEMHARALMDVSLTGVYLTGYASYGYTSHRRAFYRIYISGTYTL